MHRWTAVAAGLVVALASAGPALAQPKPGCDERGRVMTPQRVDGQVIKIDAARNRVTIREGNGQLHEFEASAETLQGLKIGDRLSASLREAPKCP